MDTRSLARPSRRAFLKSSIAVAAGATTAGRLARTHGAEAAVGDLTFKLGDPVVVAQAPREVHGWGHWQFPSIRRLPDGNFLAGFHLGSDSATTFGLPGGRAVSDDEGRTWRMLGPEERPIDGHMHSLRLPNGDLLRQVQMRPIEAKSIAAQLPAPVGEMDDGYGLTDTAFAASQLPKSFAGYRFARLPQGSQEWGEETAVVNFPGEVRSICEGVLVRPFFHSLKLAPDRSLWALIRTKRLVEGKLQRYTAVQVFRSVDNGHTFDFLSEILYQPDRSVDLFADVQKGLTEPALCFVKDGSAFCVMRTTQKNQGPLYESRSSDGGKTWSKTAVFDEWGVSPQLLALNNGSTLASYGRPGVLVSASRDPLLRTWKKRIATIISEPKPSADKTCGYTGMAEITDSSALVIYSDFKYPDAEGVERKTILVRRIEVT